jgi:hypothetical protein
MPATFGLLLDETNARRLRRVAPEVQLVLLERTLFDPPRAAAGSRWASLLHRSFPNAELVPYVWHLVSHGAEDGLREHGSRTLEGPPQAFGQLQATPEVDRAWDALMQCVNTTGAKRLVMRTPPSITPGALGRKRIASFVEAKRSAGIELVWEPQGLWSPIEASMFARELGIPMLHAAFVGGRPLFDDDDRPRLVARDAWLRVDPTSRRPQLSADQLDAIIDHLDYCGDATLVFTGPHAIANLHRAHKDLVASPTP